MEEETNKEEPEKNPEPGREPGSAKEPESAKEPQSEQAPGTAGEPAAAQGSEEAKAEEAKAEEERHEVPPPAEEEPYSRPPHHRRLYRSRTNRILFGVCGGLGEYLNIDPVIIRLIFILSFLIGGWGFLAYIIAALLMPNNPAPVPPEAREESRLNAENSRIILGSALILLGLYALLRTTGVLHYFSFFGLTHEFIIPLILIALGIVLVFKHRDFLYRQSPETRRLYRSSKNRMIAGVCAGLGIYLDIDPTLIRIIWVVLTFGSFGVGIVIYVLFALLVPLDSEVNLEK